MQLRAQLNEGAGYGECLVVGEGSHFTSGSREQQVAVIGDGDDE